MVNASLNWTSIIGIICFFYGLATAPMGVAQIVFTLNRRADNTKAIRLKSTFHFIQATGRLIGLPLVGLIMFFQGWRLDPLLQFSTFILTFGIIFESAPAIISDFRQWRATKN